jgi:hypothetical protein
MSLEAQAERVAPQSDLPRHRKADGAKAAVAGPLHHIVAVDQHLREVHQSQKLRRHLQRGHAVLVQFGYLACFPPRQAAEAAGDVSATRQLPYNQGHWVKIQRYLCYGC